MADAGTDRVSLTARDAGLVGCPHCMRVWPIGQPRCGSCNARLVSRNARSLSRVWAWLAAGFLFYIPANTYPMLITNTLVESHSSTIIGGAVELAQYGEVAIAVIILVASVLIPISKFIAVGFLALSVRYPSKIGGHHRHALYEVVEFIGRWSMIDVFVVAITSALVQLNAIASIQPGPAAIAFALSVIFTMLAAQSFDSRMIWDSIEKEATR